MATPEQRAAWPFIFGIGLFLIIGLVANRFLGFVQPPQTTYLEPEMAREQVLETLRQEAAPAPDIDEVQLDVPPETTYQAFGGVENPATGAYELVEEGGIPEPPLERGYRMPAPERRGSWPKVRIPPWRQPQTVSGLPIISSLLSWVTFALICWLAYAALLLIVNFPKLIREVREGDLKALAYNHAMAARERERRRAYLAAHTRILSIFDPVQLFWALYRRVFGVLPPEGPSPHYIYNESQEVKKLLDDLGY